MLSFEDNQEVRYTHPRTRILTSCLVHSCTHARTHSLPHALTSLFILHPLGQWESFTAIHTHRGGIVYETNRVFRTLVGTITSRTFHYWKSRERCHLGSTTKAEIQSWCDYRRNDKSAVTKHGAAKGGGMGRVSFITFSIVSSQVAGDLTRWIKLVSSTELLVVRPHLNTCSAHANLIKVYSRISAKSKPPVLETDRTVKSSQRAVGKYYLFYSPSQERFRHFPSQEGSTRIFPRKDVFPRIIIIIILISILIILVIFSLTARIQRSFQTRLTGDVNVK